MTQHAKFVSRATGEGYIACTGSGVHAQVLFLSFSCLSFPLSLCSCFLPFVLFFSGSFFLPPFYMFVTCFFIYVYCFFFALFLSTFCLYTLFLSSLIYLIPFFCVFLFSPLSFIRSLYLYFFSFFLPFHFLCFFFLSFFFSSTVFPSFHSFLLR